MANTNQSEKRARQNRTRRLRGQSFRSRYRTMVKRARAAADNEDGKAFAEAFATMQSVADRAVAKKLMHRNTVARIKRRICRMRPEAEAPKA